MFGWFKKKPRLPEILYFKSNDAAFEYASKYMQGPLLNDSMVVGQVLGMVEPEIMSWKWRVRLATEHGVLETDHCGSIANELSANLKLKSLPIQPGDLVAVQVAKYDPKYSFDHLMQYFVITWKLKPKLSVESHAFVPDVDQ